MNGDDHRIIVRPSSKGGYECLQCQQPVVLMTHTKTWVHQPKVEKRAEMKDFTPQYSGNIQIRTKNRRDALFAASSSLPSESDEVDILYRAEEFERWLNRPLGEYWYEEEGQQGATPLRVVEDEMQEHEENKGE